MSTSTRVTRSKGESDGLSLPMRMRPTRKDTTLGRNEGGKDQQQWMPTQMPTQSPQATATERTEATTSMLPPGPHRPLTPCVPLPVSPISSSVSSAPLFKEDKYSSTSEEESEVEAEVTFLHNRSCLSGTFANNQPERPTSTPTTSDYMTQGDPNASPSASNLFGATTTNNEFLNTNNFFHARRQQLMNPPDIQQSFSGRLSGKWQQCISPGTTGSGENAKHTEVSDGCDFRTILCGIRK